MWKSFLRLFLEAKFVARFRCSLRLHLCGAPVKTAVFMCVYEYIRFIIAERILVKFDVGLLYENLSGHFTFRVGLTGLKPTQQETDRHFCTQFAHLRQECHNSKFGVFLVTGVKRNFCRCTFNRNSVVAQFVKLAAGAHLCRRCTQKIIALQNL